MNLLIGSRAAKHWYDDFREPKDWDYLTDDKKNSSYIEGSNRVEYHYVDSNNPGLYSFISKPRHQYNKVACPSSLYTLKVSHSFWNIRWEKTMHDILWFQQKGVDFDKDLFELLYKDWEILHGKKRAYLKKSNDDFFTDGVKRIYVHDDLHKAVAYYDEPLYKRCKKDQDSALLSKSLFDNMSYYDKLRLCREEIYVTALERYLIPDGFKLPAAFAYRRAAKQLITSMTKGWFPLFIVMNWRELCRPDTHNFVEIFKEKEHECRKVEKVLAR